MQNASKPVSRVGRTLCCTALFLIHTIGSYFCQRGVFKHQTLRSLSAFWDSRIHPPGYPLLSVWGGLFQWMSDNPMWNTAVAMGLFHSIAVVLLFDALDRWTKDRWLSLWVVGLLMTQPLWIRYSTISRGFSGVVFGIRRVGMAT